MKYKTHYEKKDGWTDWETPNMKLYKLMCCDCGLVHDFQFQEWEKIKDLLPGRFGSMGVTAKDNHFCLARLFTPNINTATRHQCPSDIHPG